MFHAAYKDVQAIVLAAGASKRFQTGRTKLVEELCGLPMIVYITKLLEKLAIQTTIVVGYQEQEIKRTLQAHHTIPFNYALQTDQKGTGHALLCSKPSWDAGTLIVINGDMPLLTAELIDALYQTHTVSHAALSFVVTPDQGLETKDYGKVVHQTDSIKIVEAKDFTQDCDYRGMLNAGIYAIQRDFLERTLQLLTNDNKAQEFYVTDLIAHASKLSSVTMLQAPFNSVRGVNTLEQLACVEQLKQQEIIKHWMAQGVRCENPATTRIDYSVVVHTPSKIGAGVHLLGTTQVGANSVIEPYSIVRDATIANNVIIKSHSVISNSVIENNVQIGPFAHIEDNCVIKNNAILGNFVHAKRSTLGSFSKAKHLTYLGDAQLGNGVNIGGGTITCNYSGGKKEQTIIGDNVFIGSNNTLIAPISIEADSYTAGGSTLTLDVPRGSLALGRARQVNKLGYARILLDKKRALKTMNTLSAENSSHSFVFNTTDLPSHVVE